MNWWNKLPLPTPPAGKKIAIGDPPDHTGGLLIIGEAPGRQEEIAGKPFVGEAGKVLREALKEAGVGQHFFINVCLWRPGQGYTDVPPSAADIKACEPWVKLFIANYSPQRILVVGATAAHALWPKGPYTRGTVRTLHLFGKDYRCWLTHHPARTIYEPDTYTDFVWDVERFVRGLEPDDSPTELIDSWPSQIDLAALDTELSDLSLTHSRILCVAVSPSPGKAKVLRELRIQDLPSAPLVGHNSLVDEVALRLNGIPVQFSEDTLLYHYAHDERKGTHSLKSLAPTLANATTAEDLVWDYIHGEAEDGKSVFEGIPQERLEYYCARDADVTLRLWYALKERFQDHRLALYKFLMDARGMLVESTIRGLFVDSHLLTKSISDQQNRVENKRKEFGEVNPNSPQQVLHWLRKNGYQVDNTSEATLRELEGPIPKLLLEYREENKILTAFLLPMQEMIASGDPIIRPLYKLHGTETGRLSCENPNIQQFPESLKSLIMAREGHTLIGWDYSQLEVRVQAWLCEDPLMISMLESGVDFHAETGKLLGLDRRDAKRLNFLIQYGGGAAKAARTLGISQSAAQKLITEYYKRFAGLAQWKEKIREQIIKEGVVETPFGRARHFDFITDRLLPNLHREACNFVPQSVASDLNLWTALAVYKRTGIPACLLVHDFAAFEVPNEQLEDFLPVIKEELQKLPEPMQIKNSPIAFEAKVKIGPSWGAMKEVD